MSDGKVTYENMTAAEVQALSKSGRLSVMVSVDSLHFGILSGGESGTLLKSLFNDSTVIADEGSKYIAANRNFRMNFGQGTSLVLMRPSDTELGMNFKSLQEMRKSVLEQNGLKSLRDAIVNNLAKLGQSGADKPVFDEKNRLVDNAVDGVSMHEIYRQTIESSNLTPGQKAELLGLNETQLRDRLADTSK